MGLRGDEERWEGRRGGRKREVLPCTADAGASFDDLDAQIELPQPIYHIKARHACSNQYDVVIEVGGRGGGGVRAGWGAGAR